MRMTGRALACVVLLALASAAGAEEVHFEKGKSSTLLRGTIHLKGGWDTGAPTYELRAAEGQTLTVRFKGDPGASYSVFCPAGAGTESGAAEWSSVLPESGLFSIHLQGRGERETEKALAYELEVAVTGRPHKVAVPGVTGTYTRDGEQDGTLEVIEMPGGKLRFHWDGTWNPPGASPDEGRANLGTLGGTATIRKGKAVYREKGYTMTMVFARDGSLVIREDGSPPFGMNVTARGEYVRISRCAGPGRWKGVD
ncbi:MAG TPA: hypothetical protein VFR03_15765 [Thermoanaerobaculia bacterium]|nr:hypothetical protein [Thermoanaerobaculia bacterium]